MDLLNDIKALHDKWDAKGGHSGDDKYEDALYDCINELADVIIKHEKAAAQSRHAPDGESSALLEGVEYYIEYIDAETITLRRRR